MSALLALALLAVAAPRTPYGGAVVVLAEGAPRAIEPWAFDTLAGMAASAEVFEPLYRLGPEGALVPVLASGLPAARGDELAIPLRADVKLHDGRALTPRMVAAALERLADQGSFAMTPVKGAAARSRGERAPLGVTAGEREVVLSLVAPYPEAARLLASAHAAIAVPLEGRPGFAGTGPFRAGPGGVLLAFGGHRDGRPFIDSVGFEAPASAFDARAKLKRGEAQAALGWADLGGALRVEGPGAPPLVLYLLAVGKQGDGLRLPARIASMNAALDRARLAKRYLSQGARAAATLSGDAAGGEQAPLDRGPAVQVSLLVSSERGPSRRFTERVQLDLLRAGVSAAIQLATEEELRSRRLSGDYALMIDLVLLERPPLGDAADHLHQLLSVAARHGLAAEAVPASELSAFARADEAGRRARLEALDRSVRASAALIPIATEPQPAWQSASLVRAVVAPGGALRLEDAHLLR